MKLCETSSALDSRPRNQYLLRRCSWFQTVIFSSLQVNYCRNRGVMKEITSIPAEGKMTLKRRMESAGKSSIRNTELKSMHLSVDKWDWFFHFNVVSRAAVIKLKVADVSSQWPPYPSFPQLRVKAVGRRATPNQKNLAFSSPCALHKAAVVIDIDWPAMG